MGPKMASLFSRIWSKKASKSDVDPKMAPKDARGPQDGPPRPKNGSKMIQNESNKYPKWIQNETDMEPKSQRKET